MNIRALAYDLARSQRADLGNLKRVVDALAEFGYNMMTVNLEHRFEFPSCPGLAPPGALTAAMARGLVEYGRERGVEVVAQPNLTGHTEGIGATERYAALTCDPCRQAPWGGYEQLNLERPEARDLVRRMMHDVMDAFPGDTIHIGGDEIRRMDYLFPDDEARRIAKMAEYLNGVIDIAREHGRTVMLWGDMPLHHPEIMEQLSRDLIICDWHYGAEGSRGTLEQYKKEGFRVLASPAVGTCGAFAVDTDGTRQNLANMIGDARDLGLDGFLLTTWEFGFGSGVGLIWPWVAMAAAIADGKDVPDWKAFVSDIAAERYGVDGPAFARLHELMSTELKAAFPEDAHFPVNPLRAMRKYLFRAAPAFAGVARCGEVPGTKHREVWEPSPFIIWHYLRPVLDAAVLGRLRAVADEAVALASTLRDSVTSHAEETAAVFGLAGALGVLADRLELLSKAWEHYHEAAKVQQEDPRAFGHQIAKTAACLEALRPGIESLRDVVRSLDETMGLDPGELHWLDIHEQHLDEHLDALRRLTPDGDALLEFGEFLKRPANITQRLTWR